MTRTTTYRESLGTCIECKKQDMNSMSQLVKIFKLAVSPHLDLQHVEEVFPDIYSLNVLEINSKSSYYKYNLITNALLVSQTIRPS